MVQYSLANSFTSVNDAVPPCGGRIFFLGAPGPQLGILLHAIGILHRIRQENSEKMCIVSGLHDLRRGINRGFEPCLAWWQLEQQCEELSLG